MRVITINRRGRYSPPLAIVRTSGRTTERVSE